MKKCIIIRKENYLHFPTCVQCRSRVLRIFSLCLLLFSPNIQVFWWGTNIQLMNWWDTLNHPQHVGMWLPELNSPCSRICSVSLRIHQKIIFLSIYSMTAMTPREYFHSPPISIQLLHNNRKYFLFTKKRNIYKELNIDMEITLHSSLFLSLHKSNR